ncbi:hypothetical protein AUL39_03140 [Tractidigestivibacter scatoligenes]|uniref:Uncharacterized protein n=1 Tax=Tractidigestivibacter scatoligenes TaxID=1299998 RepID=A0A100YX59_TRASO|nr:hypothetical protein [Tractidigestivibacter scatoligenes]KUH59329.1 hypothetical protein AUL39_03140 [Tractidigestivibacter scatoligenes]
MQSNPDASEVTARQGNGEAISIGNHEKDASASRDLPQCNRAEAEEPFSESGEAELGRPASTVVSPAVSILGGIDRERLVALSRNVSATANHIAAMGAAVQLPEVKPPIANIQGTSELLRGFTKDIVTQMSGVDRLSSAMVSTVQSAISTDSAISSAMGGIAAIMQKLTSSGSTLANAITTASSVSSELGQISEFQLPGSLEFGKDIAAKMAANNEAIESSVGSMAKALRSVWGHYGGIADAVVARLRSTIPPVLDQLAVLPGFDWNSIQDGLVKWGEYGWVFVAEAPIDLLLHVPGSRKDADRIMRSYASPRHLVKVRARLAEKARKRRDLEEALWLFDSKHYKPCAMMLCALIEGELLVRARKGEGRRGKRRPKEPIERMKSQCRPTDPEAFEALGAFASFDHFFAQGNDFDRSVEDDLNRNFLQHGMMYKPVTRTVCVKLILLLNALIVSFDTYL